MNIAANQNLTRSGPSGRSAVRVISLCIFVGSLSGSACSKPADTDDLCSRITTKLTRIKAGQKRNLPTPQKVEQRAARLAAYCRRDGVSQAQADCVFAFDEKNELETIRDCPALHADAPRWMMLPETPEEREQLSAFFRQPDGPYSTPLRYVDLAASGGTTCGLREDGSLQCWGEPSSLPDGDLVEISWKAHLCGRQRDGRLRCATDTRGDNLSYLPKEALRGFSEGSFHGCALRESDGSVRCWAKESRDALTPPLGSFVQVASGNVYSCALDKEGGVDCFGPEAPSPPAPLPSEEAFSSLAAGMSHVCGIQHNGRLRCFGRNSRGQSTPPPGVFKQLSCQNWRCCAIAADDSAACWGEPLVPGAPAGAFDVIEVGPEHACASGPTGTACWGSNHMGQRNVPQPAADGSAAHNWRRFNGSP